MTLDTTLDRTLQIIQMAYPQVYLACHTRHHRKRTTAHRLSARDSAILAHLHPTRPMIATRLATHLSVSKSTLSEALKRLTSLGYVTHSAADSGVMKRGVLLTDKGVHAIEDTSVLEAERLRGVLSHLSTSEMRAVAKGMNVLALASRAWSATQREDTKETS